MILRDLVPFVLPNAWQTVFQQDAKCPIDIPLTCQNKTEVGDSCCFEYPGGIFIQTQFWNYRPSRPGLSREEIEDQLGPIDAFTIHGLWPDNCDGGYEQFCDRSLAIDDVYHLLQSDQFNKTKYSYLEIDGKELLGSLEKLWKSNNGDHESLWIHEFNKHGTCIKTLRPTCYSNSFQNTINDSLKRQAVYDYFRIAKNLYDKLDTFKLLERNGIVPSVEATYTREQIKNALQNEFDDHDVFIGCDSHNSLNEIWYFHLLQGSILNETFVPIDALKSYSRCSAENIKFYPKGHIPSSNEPGDGRNPTYARGTIRLSPYEGFLIKNGKWMTKGTPANFELQKAPFGNYYLKSRTGYCGLAPSTKTLICNKNIRNAEQFDYDESHSYLGLSGSFEWGTDTYPRGNKQSPIHIASQEDKFTFKLKFTKK